MNRTSRVLAVALAAVLTAAPFTAHAATITIVNLDGAGEGFNDPTPAAPVGGNAGTTVGQQRLNVFNQAAAIWGAILPSAVPIAVSAQFNGLTCSSTSGTLGSAGPLTVHTWAGAEFARHWYHQALANKLRGIDSDVTKNDIQAIFNSSVGTPGCLDTAPWYYGFDHAQSSGLDLLAVVLHELGHGLGFSTTTNVSTGVFLGTAPDDLPSVFDKFLLDRTAGLHWDQMASNAARQASAINTGNLVWDGTAVSIMAPQLLQRQRLRLFSQSAILGSYSVGVADFGPRLNNPGVTANLVLATDGVGPNVNDGCEAYTNAAAMNFKIALVDRGNCTFAQKAANAQAAGAIGLVIANTSNTVFDMVGTDPSITIPLGMISLADGNTVKAQLGAGVFATLGLDPFVHPGTALDAGKYRPLMYAPNPVQPGSSVSHFDVTAEPNVLMEPAINVDLTNSIDLTRYAFEDMGWLPRTTIVTGVTPGASPAGMAMQGAPNPFRASTSLRLSLPTSGMVELTVLDVSGRSVRELAHAWMPAGAHLIAWDGTDRDGRTVPAGVYLTRLKVGTASVTQRIVRIQ